VPSIGRSWTKVKLIRYSACILNWYYNILEVECDHGRSVWYFVESINSPFAFTGCNKCDSWNNYVKGRCPCSETESMGEHSSHSSRGIFYLFTRGESPFGLGPHMNLTLQSFDEYDPEWMTYDHTRHNFTSSSAKQFLQKVMQKSVQRLSSTLQTQSSSPAFHLPTIQNMPSIPPQPRSEILSAGTQFRTQLVNRVKRNAEKFHNAVARPVRESNDFTI